MIIKDRRVAKGMTQGELARLIGVSAPAIAQWECGDTNPSADKLPAIAAALGCTIDDLFKHDTGR